MKILAISASPRGDQGHTRFLIDKLFQGAVSAESLRQEAPMSP